MFQSTAEQVTDEFGDRELGIMAELIKKKFVLVRNRRVNVFVACKFFLRANGSHVLSLAVVNSRSAALIIQSSHLLMRV